MRSTRVYARQHDLGMIIYAEKSGEKAFVTTHRNNNRLYFYLCDEGRTLYEMKSYKPGRTTLDQRFDKSLKFLIKQTELALNELAV